MFYPLPTNRQSLFSLRRVSFCAQSPTGYVRTLALPNVTALSVMTFTGMLTMFTNITQSQIRVNVSP